jgi:kynureninase
LAKALAAECRRRRTSLNRTVIDLLGRALGAGAETNGIEALAGTWSRAELAAFERATAQTERIDEELWK